MYLCITELFLSLIVRKYYVCLRVCFVIVVLFGFVSTPVCGNGAGRQVYICSLFCLVGRVKSCQVCAFMWTLMLTADFCPLPHLEA